MSKNHDDIDQDTTAAEAADSLKAWLASPAQGDTHAEDSEAASEPENTPNEDAPGDDAEEDAQEGTQEPQEEPGDHQREDDTPAAPEAASGPERRPQCRCDALRQAHLTRLELGQVRRPRKHGSTATTLGPGQPRQRHAHARRTNSSAAASSSVRRRQQRGGPRTSTRSTSSASVRDDGQPRGRDYPPRLTLRPPSVLVANTGSEF